MRYRIPLTLSQVYVNPKCEHTFWKAHTQKDTHQKGCQGLRGAEGQKEVNRTRERPSIKQGQQCAMK